MLGDEEKKVEGLLWLLDVLFQSGKDVEERKFIREEGFHIVMDENMKNGGYDIWFKSFQKMKSNL